MVNVYTTLGGYQIKITGKLTEGAYIGFLMHHNLYEILYYSPEGVCLNYYFDDAMKREFTIHGGVSYTPTLV